MAIEMKKGHGQPRGPSDFWDRARAVPAQSKGEVRKGGEAPLRANPVALLIFGIERGLWEISLTLEAKIC